MSDLDDKASHWGTVPAQRFQIPKELIPEALRVGKDLIFILMILYFTGEDKGIGRG